ncbi:hypothetical protein WG954_14415 [Lacibacter sp. H375]|uniref:hypothetical protein n=1 Tax=Lacibacter sp. H375 TaxID=3133424 RepID=UPI0030BFCAE3
MKPFFCCATFHGFVAAGDNTFFSLLSMPDNYELITIITVTLLFTRNIQEDDSFGAPCLTAAMEATDVKQWV